MYILYLSFKKYYGVPFDKNATHAGFNAKTSLVKRNLVHILVEGNSLRI